jgi:heptosyltransferase-3
MERMKAGYTEVWVPSQVVPLIQFADRASRLPSAIDRLGLPGIDPPVGLLDHLRGFDSIVSWYGSNQPLFRKNVEVHGLPFQFFPALPTANDHTHIVDFLLTHARAQPGTAPRIEVKPVEHGSIVMHPFSGSPRKNWPMAKFRALVERLPGRVEWCAAPHEQLPGAVKIENLYDLACWIAGARLYIGNDAGITHLAAAVGVPVVAIFGPTDPAVWAPRGKTVRVVAGDIESLPVETVRDAVMKVLSETESVMANRA